MKKDERRTVASAIVKKSRRLSLEELAARGQRHVRVLTAGEAFEEIESVVDATSTERANEIAKQDRAWVFEEAKQQFERAARLRSDSERLVREQGLLVREDADRVDALEKKLREELQELKASVKALEAKSPGTDPRQIETLLDELARRQEASRSELESRLETTMSATIDAVRKTVVAALKGTGDTSIDATSLIVAKVLDDQADALQSNVSGIEVVESRVSKGVGANLARLRQLRRGPATTEPSETVEPKVAKPVDPESSQSAEPGKTANPSQSAEPGKTAVEKPTAASGKATPRNRKAAGSSKPAGQKSGRRSRKPKKGRSN